MNSIKIGLLTVDEVQKFPGIKNYNYYLQTAIQQEKAYNAAGGLEGNTCCCNAQLKVTSVSKLYGRFGELGGIDDGNGF